MKLFEFSKSELKTVCLFGAISFLISTFFDVSSGGVDAARVFGAMVGSLIVGFVFVVWRKRVKSFEEKRGESNGRTTRKI